MTILMQMNDYLFFKSNYKCWLFIKNRKHVHPHHQKGIKKVTNELKDEYCSKNFQIAQ